MGSAGAGPVWVRGQYLVEDVVASLACSDFNQPVETLRSLLDQYVPAARVVPLAAQTPYLPSEGVGRGGEQHRSQHNVAVVTNRLLRCPKIHLCYACVLFCDGDSLSSTHTTQLLRLDSDLWPCLSCNPVFINPLSCP